jgi:hypothetical protein
MTNRFYFFLFLGIGFIALTQIGCGSTQKVNPIKSIKIVDKPITWDTLRKRLSLEYIHAHYGMNEVRTPLITPSMVVIHWTDIPTLASSFNTFKPSILQGRAELQAASTLNVSAHFLVDRDGTIYRLLPETAFARHVIGLNHCAIGIENVGDGAQYKLTEAQFKANVELVQYLHYKYPIRYVIGHMDYATFKNHPLWKELDPDYLTEKVDPGNEWMERLYKAFNQVGVFGISRFPKSNN